MSTTRTHFFTQTSPCECCGTIPCQNLMLVQSVESVGRPDDLVATIVDDFAADLRKLADE